MFNYPSDAWIDSHCEIFKQHSCLQSPEETSFWLFPLPLIPLPFLSLTICSLIYFFQAFYVHLWALAHIYKMHVAVSLWKILSEFHLELSERFSVAALRTSQLQGTGERPGSVR
jgi:hypothetical protein